MIEQLTYRFTSRKRLLDRMPIDQGAMPSPKDIADSNDRVIDRLKDDFNLNEASDIGDLRDAVRRLCE